MSQKTKVIAMLALIKAGVVSVLRDEYDNIIALNWVGKSTGIKYAKQVMGHLTVGATEEERQADEAALRKFIEDYRGVDVLHTLKVAMRLNKETLTDEDVAYLERELDNYVASHKEVVTREVRVPSPATDHPITTGTGRGKYPGLLDGLYALSNETLKNLKNEANRKGQKDLYNACRKALRAHGINA